MEKECYQNMVLKFDKFFSMKIEFFLQKFVLDQVPNHVHDNLDMTVFSPLLKMYHLLNY